MPNEDGLTPGDDVGAPKNDGKGGNGNADEKTTPGNDKGDSEGKGEKPVTFQSQKELDSLIQRRVDRALKSEKEKSELSETDRLRKEAADAKAEVRERDIRDEFISDLNVDAKTGRRLFNAYRDELDVDDKGKVTNQADVIKAIKADFPDLFKTKKVQGGGDGGTGGRRTDQQVGGDMNSALRRMAGKS